MKYTEKYDSSLIEMIDEAYDFASDALLKLLMNEYDLLNRIRWVILILYQIQSYGCLPTLFTVFYKYWKPLNSVAYLY